MYAWKTGIACFLRMIGLKFFRNMKRCRFQGPKGILLRLESAKNTSKSYFRKIRNSKRQNTSLKRQNRP